MARRGEPYGVASIHISDRDSRVVWIKEGLHLLNNSRSLCTWTPAGVGGAGSQRVAEYLQAISCTAKHGNILWFAKQNAGGVVTKVASSHLRRAQRTPYLWVYKGRFSSKNRFTGARPENMLAICLYGQSIADPAVNQDERQGFWFQLLFPPTFPPCCKIPIFKCAHLQWPTIFRLLWATLWPEQNRSIKDLPAQRRKLINIITAHHWHSGSEVIQTHQKMPNLSMSTENLPLPLTLAGWWRQLGIAGASVASKGASANVWWDSGD